MLLDYQNAKLLQLIGYIKFKKKTVIMAKWDFTC